MTWRTLIPFLLLGGLLRAWLAWQLPLMGDEVGTLLYMQSDAQTLLSSFREPWLSMGPYILLTRWVGQFLGMHPFLLRLPVLLSSLALLVCMPAILRQLRVPAPAQYFLIALATFHPHLIYQSYNLRSYGIVLLAMAGAVLHLLRWLEQPGWRSGFICGLFCGMGWLANFSFAYGLFALAGIGLWSLFTPWSASETGKRLLSSVSIVLPVALCLLPAMAYHAAVWQDMNDFRISWSGPSPTPVDYVPHWSRTFFGKGWLGFPALFLAIGSWGAAIRTAPRLALLVGLGVGVPVLVYSLSGSQHYPWGSTRILLVVLPFFLIQMSWGLTALHRQHPRLAIPLLLLILLCWIPAVLHQHRTAQIEPWTHVQSFLRQELKSGDSILAPGHNHLHLLPGFLEQQDRLLYPNSDLTSLELDTVQPTRLLLVLTNFQLSDPEPLTRKGDIYVYSFEAESLGAALKKIVQSVIPHLDNPDLRAQTGLLRGISNIMSALEWPLYEQIEMQRMYFHAFIQSPRGQHMPPAQRKRHFP